MCDHQWLRTIISKTDEQWAGDICTKCGVTREIDENNYVLKRMHVTVEA